MCMKRWAETEMGLIERRAFIRSWNVVSMCCRGGGDHRLARSVGGVTCYWIKKWWRCIAYWCIQTKWSITGVYFSIVCGCHGEHRRIKSHFAPFAFTFLDHTTCLFLAWLFCTGKQACWKHIWHDLSGSKSGVLHRGLWFSGYLVYLQMLPFCILQRVSKHCVAMLILLNLHWQAALMVFFMCLFGYSLCLWPLTVLDKQLVVTM